jgi:non-ribosomal peptide synthase protein (TIGR01720 family)
LARLSGHVTVLTEKELFAGPVPFTASQRWFLETGYNNLNYYNIAFLLEIKEHVTFLHTRLIVEQLIYQHDALRLRLQQEEHHKQLIIGLPDIATFVRFFDLSRLMVNKQDEAVQELIVEAQTHLNLSEGPLFQIYFCDLGASRKCQLLVVSHYLTADLLSWQLILQDINQAVEQITRGESIQLQTKTTSVRQWTERLVKYTGLKDIRQELSYWLSSKRRNIESLPIDFEGGHNTVESVRSVFTRFTGEETNILLNSLTKLYGVQIDVILLTALALAFMKWTGKRAFLVELLGHGREALFDDIDLSHTVGSLNTTFPLLLELPVDTSLTNAIRSISKQISSMPNHGIGYGLLRYLSEDSDVVQSLRHMPQPEVYFNLVGIIPELPNLTIVGAFGGHLHDKQGVRPRALAITALSLVQGLFEIEWEYSENIHSQSTIMRLAQDAEAILRRMIEGARQQIG